MLTTLGVILFIGTSVFATDGNEKTNAKTKLAVVQNEQAKFKLVYLESASGEVTIKLRNNLGVVIHKQTVNSEGGFSQPYDFNSLPAGEYKFELIKSDGTVLSQKIEHKAWEKQTDFKADVLNINDDKRFRLAVTQSEEVKVKIYNDKFKLVHQETLNGSKGIRRNYDLSQLNGNSFTFEVSNESGTISMDAN